VGDQSGHPPRGNRASLEGWEGSGRAPSLLAEQRRGWSLMIFCARATRGLRRPSLDARSGRSISPHPWRDNEQAWKGRRAAWSIPRARCPRTEDQLDCQIKGRARSMRAVRDRTKPPLWGVVQASSEEPLYIVRRVHSWISHAPTAPIDSRQIQNGSKSRPFPHRNCT